MRRLIEPGAGRPLPLDEVLDVEAVLDAAQAWAEERMTTTEAANVGGLLSHGRPSPAYTRFRALAKTSMEDPRWVMLDALCRHLVRLQGYRDTRQGLFSGFEAAYCARETQDMLDNGVIWRGFRDMGNW